MLKNKTILIGVSGSIAAYKSAVLVSSLVKLGADVHVFMTKNACNFVNPITFETLTHNKCLTDTFDRNFQFDVQHVSLAKKADLFMIAPATANVIAKIANGLADDMLTTTFLACSCPKIISPAMNTGMYENPITQDNIEKCSQYGIQIAEPQSGYLACGDTGKGKMEESEILLEYILNECECEHDLTGKKILVTAGPTVESIDPVRFISNRSTGKMGYAIVRAATKRGADVTLVTGPVHEKLPLGVECIKVESAKEMFEAVRNNFEKQDAVIKAAAVADYTPSSCAEDKIKKSDGDMKIELERTTDILSWLGQNKKDHQKICGFSMETKDLLENSKLKLSKKNCDMICANNLKVQGAGFGVDTNVITMIKPDEVIELPVMSKEAAAHKILDALFSI